MVYDVIVNLDKFVFPANCSAWLRNWYDMSVILHIPFLITCSFGWCGGGQLKVQVNDEVVNFYIHRSMKYPSDMHVVSHLDQIDEVVTSIDEDSYSGETLSYV